MARIAERARTAGAFVAVACPTWGGVQLQDVLGLPAVHAIETWNEVGAIGNGRGDSWHLLDGAAAHGRKLLGLAVDDAHFGLDYPDWFAAWAMVRAEELTPEALLAALKAGHYYSSRGPEIHDLRIEGGELRLSCSPARAIIAAGRAHLGMARHGAQMTDAVFPLDRFAGSYVRLTVIDRNGLQAWTNPIWLDE
jgi:hypothetical protein